MSVLIPTANILGVKNAHEIDAKNATYNRKR